MKLRKSVIGDLEKIVSMVEQAKRYLREQGSSQWQDGYPNEETLRGDIDKDESYVVEDENGEVCATFVLSFRGEPTYSVIDGGEWLTPDDAKYGVVHRIAIDDRVRGRGVGELIFREVEPIAVENNAKSIRVDTHRLNKPMQRISEKLEYQYCGIIYVRDGDRLAYEKILIEK